MRQYDRTRIFETLRGPIVADKTTNTILDKVAEEDTETLEPVIDDMIEQSFRAGKLAILLERAWEIQQPLPSPQRPERGAGK